MIVPVLLLRLLDARALPDVHQAAAPAEVVSDAAGTHALVFHSDPPPADALAPIPGVETVGVFASVAIVEAPHGPDDLGPDRDALYRSADRLVSVTDPDFGPVTYALYARPAHVPRCYRNPPSEIW